MSTERPLRLQVKPSVAPLNELQSQLNDMLDDSASDDAASLSQFTSAGPFMQQPPFPTSPIMRQGAGVSASPSQRSMQDQLQPAVNSAQSMQQANSTGQDAQAAQLKAQLQVEPAQTMICHADTLEQGPNCMQVTLQLLGSCVYKECNGLLAGSRTIEGHMIDVGCGGNYVRKAPVLFPP